MGFVGIFELGVAVIECIQSSGWTGYVLMKVRDDLFEVSFVKVSSDDTCSIRMFVDISAEFIVEFGQSHASICLRWDVNGRHEDRCKFPGQIEGAADNGEVF